MFSGASGELCAFAFGVSAAAKTSTLQIIIVRNKTVIYDIGLPPVRRPCSRVTGGVQGLERFAHGPFRFRTAAGADRASARRAARRGKAARRAAGRCA